jgi:hypothetical protein
VVLVALVLIGWVWEPPTQVAVAVDITAVAQQGQVAQAAVVLDLITLQAVLTELLILAVAAADRAVVLMQALADRVW